MCLSMHPDRVIARTDRRSDVLSTRPDYQNTLTCQSADTNDAPRDPLHGPVTHPLSVKKNLPCLPAATGSVPWLWHRPGGEIAGGPLSDATWSFHGCGSGRSVVEPPPIPHPHRQSTYVLDVFIEHGGTVGLPHR